MEISPRLALSYLAPSQAQKHVTVNETFRRLDALVQLTVSSRSISAEPASPAEGEAYILPPGASGAAWSAFGASDIAVFQDGAWARIAPAPGFCAFAIDETTLVAYDGASWSPVSGGAAVSAPIFGVNTSADTTNRLAVKTDAALFSHDDVTPGAGDIRIIVNKSAAAKTASHLFQNGFSGRAELGLTGDDDFHLKVSANGAAWKEAIVVDKDSGFLSVLYGSEPPFPVSISAGATGTIALNGRSINPAGLWAETTSGRSGFLFVNNNNFLPDGSNNNSTFAFWYPYDTGSNAAYKVFRISKGATLADTFWVNVDGGAVFGTPTGGDKGGGAINAQAVYDDNTLLTCYVFDQALDGAIDPQKWDALTPDRRAPDQFAVKRDGQGREIVDPKTRLPVMEKIAEGPVLEVRRHEPMRKFAARAGTAYDPLTLDGYAAHWKEKRHLTAMPNEATFDPVNGQLTTGEWIQRLVETVEIQAVLIEQLNARVKTLEAA